MQYPRGCSIRVSGYAGITTLHCDDEIAIKPGRRAAAVGMAPRAVAYLRVWEAQAPLVDLSRNTSCGVWEIRSYVSGSFSRSTAHDLRLRGSMQELWRQLEVQRPRCDREMFREQSSRTKGGLVRRDVFGAACIAGLHSCIHAWMRTMLAVHAEAAAAAFAASYVRTVGGDGACHYIHPYLNRKVHSEMTHPCNAEYEGRVMYQCIRLCRVQRRLPALKHGMHRRMYFARLQRLACGRNTGDYLLNL